MTIEVSKKTKAKQLGTVAAKSARASSGSRGGGRFRSRFEKCFAELEARDDVHFVWKWLGEPLAPAAVRAAGDKLGWKMTDDEVAFYAEMNGCTVVWVSKHDKAFDAKKLRVRTSKPRPIDYDQFSNLALESFGAFAFLPITDIASKPYDYTSVNALEGSPRIAFERPGQYYTPSLTLTKKGAVVQVGEDHGAAWNGPTCGLVDYLETVLATWGSYRVRRDIFGNKKRAKEIGKAYWSAKPLALDDLLPAATASGPDDKAVRALFKQARDVRKRPSDTDLLSMLAALPTDDADISGTFEARLNEATQAGRTALLAAQLPALLDRLATYDTPNSLANWIATLDVDFTVAQRMQTFRLANDEDARGTFAAKAGAAIVPSLAEAWDDAATDDSTRIAIIIAAIQLGAAAGLLKKRLENVLHADPDSFAHDDPDISFNDTDSIAFGAALALCAIDPTRAPKLVQHIKLALRTDLVCRASRTTGSDGSLRTYITSLFARFPKPVHAAVADAIVAMAKALSTRSEQLELLFAFGDLGLGRALALAETKPGDYSVDKRLPDIRQSFAFIGQNLKLPAKTVKRFVAK